MIDYTGPRRERLLEMFAAIDAKDARAFSEYLTGTAEFRFGSAPIVKGREQIRQAVEGFFGTIAAVRHEVELFVGDADRVLCEGQVTYTRHDGSSITLPFADSFVISANGIDSYRIYIDIAPLYAPAA